MQDTQEPAHGQPEVVPHHHQRLDPIPVALPRAWASSVSLLSFRGVQPLLELIEDDEHLSVFALQDRPLSKCGNCLGQVEVLRQGNRGTVSLNL